MSQTFENLNDHIVYTKAESRSEASGLKDEAKELSNQKNVVIFYEQNYHLYLAPGYDPYQIRKEINSWIDQNKTSTKKASSQDSSKTTTKAKVLKVKW
jgi:hypothetical protein